MFVRRKIISNHSYYYLVKSFRENNKVKQKVLEYLGTTLPNHGTIKKLKKKYSSLGQNID